MAYRYLVDYVKQVIKNRIASGQYKFMAFAFLKEVTKTGDPQLVNYLDTKILKRLYQLAVAPEGERCLTIYDKKVNLADSARFHYLLRECFTNWGSKFKTINKNYITYTQKLQKRRLVPAPEEKYWNFPEGVAAEEQLRGNSIINDFSADGLSRNDSRMEGSDISRSRSNSPIPSRPPNANAQPPAPASPAQLYANFKQQRERLVAVLLSSESKSVGSDPAVQTQLKAYREAKAAVDANPSVQAFLNQAQSGDNARVQEGLTAEYIFFDSLLSELPRDESLDAQLEFCQKLQSLHKDMFGAEVNTGPRVNYLTESSFEAVRPSQRSLQTGALRAQSQQPIAKPSRQHVPAEPHPSAADDYDYEVRSKSNNDNVGDMKFTLGLEDGQHLNDFPDPLNPRSQPGVPDNRPPKTGQSARLADLRRENQNLRSDIHELSLIREDLEQKIENSVSYAKAANQSALGTNLRATGPGVHELMSKKNQKELEIDELRRKIQRLENHVKEEEFETPKASRTRSQILGEKDPGTARSRLLRPPKVFVKTVEKSGSTFVNQMMTDINRVLTRGGGGAGGNSGVSGLNGSSNASMVRSVYQSPY